MRTARELKDLRRELAARETMLFAERILKAPLVASALAIVGSAMGVLQVALGIQIVVLALRLLWT